MDVNTYFVLCPLKIITTNLGIPFEYKQKYIKEVYSIKDYQNHSTNVKASMSSWRIWEQNPKFNILLDSIYKTIQRTNPLDNNLNQKYDLVSCWSTIYTKSNFTISHSHEPSYLSFVYYLQSDSSTPIIFDDCNFEIIPKDDLLVIFPSTLTHHVPPHKSDKDRVVIAGNLEITSKDSNCNKFAYIPTNN
tara:strand:+ start:38 stop:607 length:570 start_codon:yes stop_codon:yes gene_type:complete